MVHVGRIADVRHVCQPLEWDGVDAGTADSEGRQFSTAVSYMRSESIEYVWFSEQAKTLILWFAACRRMPSIL